LRRARTGYLEILSLIDSRAWPQPVSALVRRVFAEDLARLERAQAAGAASSWRAVVRGT
jgi:hypothetical protein